MVSAVSHAPSVPAFLEWLTRTRPLSVLGDTLPPRAVLLGDREAGAGELSALAAAWLRTWHLPSGPADCLTLVADAVATVWGAGGRWPPAE